MVDVVVNERRITFLWAHIVLLISRNENCITHKFKIFEFSNYEIENRKEKKLDFEMSKSEYLNNQKYFYFGFSKP